MSSSKEMPKLWICTCVAKNTQKKKLLLNYDLLNIHTFSLRLQYVPVHFFPALFFARLVAHGRDIWGTYPPHATNAHHFAALILKQISVSFSIFVSPFSNDWIGNFIFILLSYFLFFYFYTLINSAVSIPLEPPASLSGFTRRHFLPFLDQSVMPSKKERNSCADWWMPCKTIYVMFRIGGVIPQMSLEKHFISKAANSPKFATHNF